VDLFTANGKDFARPPGFNAGAQDLAHLSGKGLGVTVRQQRPAISPAHNEKE
jgi:hypothetical protein